MALIDKLTALGDAIRSKTGSTDKLTLDDMAEAIGNLGQGGTDFNFKIVGDTVAPTNPEPNTIWINTSAEITSWVFSTTQPTETVQGMVWIAVTNENYINITLLKDTNNIQLYVWSVMQFHNGSWVKRDTQSYQDGVWTVWPYPLIPVNYNSFVRTNFSTANLNAGSARYSLTLRGSTTASSRVTSGTAIHKGIDLTDYSQLEIEYTVGISSSSGSNTSSVSLSSAVGIYNTDGTSVQTVTGGVSRSSSTSYPSASYKKTINISSLSGEYDIRFQLNGSGSWQSSNYNYVYTYIDIKKIILR